MGGLAGATAPKRSADSADRSAEGHRAKRAKTSAYEDELKGGGRGLHSPSFRLNLSASCG